MENKVVPRKKELFMGKVFRAVPGFSAPPPPGPHSEQPRLTLTMSYIYI